MNTDFLDFMLDGTELLHVMCTAYELGKTDVIDALSGYSFCIESAYETGIYGMDTLCDLYVDYATNGDHEDENYYDSQVRTIYVSSHNLMKFYRLCREYSVLTKTKIKDNPYMKDASIAVNEQMDPRGCYYCSYILQTKINHDWASGIVFYYDTTTFYEYLPLLDKFLHVFDYYDSEVVSLEKKVKELKEIQNNKVLELPQKLEGSKAA